MTGGLEAPFISFPSSGFLWVRMRAVHLKFSLAATLPLGKFALFWDFGSNFPLLLSGPLNFDAFFLTFFKALFLWVPPRRFPPSPLLWRTFSFSGKNPMFLWLPRAEHPSPPFGLPLVVFLWCRFSLVLPKPAPPLSTSPFDQLVDSWWPLAKQPASWGPGIWPC